MIAVTGQIVQGVAQEVHVAALPRRVGQNLTNGRLQPSVIVADHELHSVQPSLPQSAQKTAPAVAALPFGHFHSKDAPPPFMVDPNRDQHRMAADRPLVTDPLVARVQNHIRIRLIQSSRGERFELTVELLRYLADRARTERMPAQLFGDRLYLPRRHSLDVHLRQGREQRLLTSLVPLE